MDVDFHMDTLMQKTGENCLLTFVSLRVQAATDAQAAAAKKVEDDTSQAEKLAAAQKAVEDAVPAVEGEASTLVQ